ncbi:hypothetical protein FEM03_01605 [Phragmitibacter flavus]|uniref:Uncharacterized protein n=1 Tax=Phragmitibacter flavus TaxID=2576071 RepID=A0A5R8KKD9_9BACT|nr:hypothetical protein [Phragmitibacter flavus]TLD72793.1 hypothetical protein FEM03_01605 [Phragmitibacter flavus]
MNIEIEPERVIKWEDWLAGRERRRAISRKVAPLGARRQESSSDKRLREAFDGERGPDLLRERSEGNVNEWSLLMSAATSLRFRPADAFDQR